MLVLIIINLFQHLFMILLHKDGNILFVQRKNKKNKKLDNRKNHKLLGDMIK